MTPTEPRTRRVADKLPSAAEQAIRLERIEGDMRLLAQRVSSAMENMTNALGSVQTEVRSCAARVSELAGLQGAHDSSKVAIGKVEKSVSELSARLESWFDEFEQKQDQRWRDYSMDRDQWRRQHEAGNEHDKRELEREIRSVRETMIRALGWGAAAGALGSVIVGGFFWSLNDRFQAYSTALSQQRETSQYNRGLIDGQREKMHEIELYLARGGVNTREPYITKQQRDGNERRK